MAKSVIRPSSEIVTQADFSDIRYAQCWEDADLLLAGLDVQPGDTCLSAVELAAFTMLIGSLGLYQRWQPLAPETSRKLFHIGGGLATLACPWLFTSAWPVVLLALTTIPTLLALKYIRALKRDLGAVLYRVDRVSFGEIYFPLSVCLSFVFAGGNPLLFLIPVLMLTLADPAAAGIGGRYGRLRYMTIKGVKSVEGSTAFFLVAFLCVLVPLLLFTSVDRVGIVLISLLVELLVMLVEAVSWEGLDNLLIPLCGCFLLAVLLPLSTVFLLIGLAVVLCLLVAAYKLARYRSVGTGVSLTYHDQRAIEKPLSVPAYHARSDGLPLTRNAPSLRVRIILVDRGSQNGHTS